MSKEVLITYEPTRIHRLDPLAKAVIAFAVAFVVILSLAISNPYITGGPYTFDISGLLLFTVPFAVGIAAYYLGKAPKKVGLS